MFGIQLFQSSAAQQFRILPHAPKCNFGLAQRLKAQSMNAFRWRVQCGTTQMFLQQLGNLGAAQIIYSNIHPNLYLLLLGA